MGCCCASFGTPNKTVVVLGTSRSGATTVLLRILLPPSSTSSPAPPPPSVAVATGKDDASSQQQKLKHKHKPFSDIARPPPQAGLVVERGSSFQRLTAAASSSPHRAHSNSTNTNPPVSSSSSPSFPAIGNNVASSQQALPTTCASKDFPPVEYNKAVMHFVDGGPALQVTKDSVLFNQLARADGVILVLDATRGFKEQRAGELIAVVEKRTNPKAPLFVLLNKFDVEEIQLTPQLVVPHLSAVVPNKSSSSSPTVPIKRPWVIQPTVAIHPRFDPRKMLSFFFDPENYVAEPLLAFSNEAIANAFEPTAAVTTANNRTTTNNPSQAAQKIHRSVLPPATVAATKEQQQKSTRRTPSQPVEGESPVVGAADHPLSTSNASVLSGIELNAVQQPRRQHQQNNESSQNSEHTVVVMGEDDADEEEQQQDEDAEIDLRMVEGDDDEARHEHDKRRRTFASGSLLRRRSPPPSLVDQHAASRQQEVFYPQPKQPDGASATAQASLNRQRGASTTTQAMRVPIEKVQRPNHEECEDAHSAMLLAEHDGDEDDEGQNRNVGKMRRGSGGGLASSGGPAKGEGLLARALNSVTSNSPIKKRLGASSSVHHSTSSPLEVSFETAGGGDRRLSDVSQVSAAGNTTTNRNTTAASEAVYVQLEQ